jgi:hypothetical protein
MLIHCFTGYLELTNVQNVYHEPQHIVDNNM